MEGEGMRGGEGGTGGRWRRSRRKWAEGGTGSSLSRDVCIVRYSLCIVRRSLCCMPCGRDLSFGLCGVLLGAG